MAQLGQGLVLEYADSIDSEDWTALARLIDYKPPQEKSAKEDTTVYDSTVMEQIQGLPEVGEAEALLEFNGATIAIIKGFHDNRTVKAWRATYPDLNTGSSDAYLGFISELGKTVPIKNKMTYSFKIQPEAGTTFTAGNNS